MKIVVLDAGTIDLPDSAWSGIREFGDLVLFPKTAHEDRALIRERCGGAEVVLTNKVPMDRATIEAIPGLRLISTLATGYNVIDVAAARDCGVTVCNVAGYSTAMTAQHALALLLEVTNRVGHHHRRVQEGAWVDAEHFWFREGSLHELDGRTVGIVGFGSIGQRFGRLANALGAEVLAYRRSPGEAPGWGPFAWVGLEDVFRRSDIVSLHCPQTPETTGMVNRERLAQMRPGAILINTARGGLVDEAAVAGALRDGRLGAYAADVVSSEPLRPDNPLVDAPNCILTPHLAWAADETLNRLLELTATNLRSFLEGKPVNVVS